MLFYHQQLLLATQKRKINDCDQVSVMHCLRAWFLRELCSRSFCGCLASVKNQPSIWVTTLSIDQSENRILLLSPSLYSIPVAKVERGLCFGVCKCCVPSLLMYMMSGHTGPLFIMCTHTNVCASACVCALTQRDYRVLRAL